MRLHRTFAAIAVLSLATLPVHATTFTDGEFVTYSPGLWGHSEGGGPKDPTVAALLENNFDAIFAPYGGYLEVGIPGPAGFSMTFLTADSVIAYLPASGNPGPLTTDLLDPVSSASGVLGGEVVAATLNVLFSEADLLAHPPGISFGDLVFQNLDTLVGQTFFLGNPVPFGPEVAALDGESVQEVLSEANLLLGGAASPLSPIEIDALMDIVDEAFNGGLVGPFAQYLTLPPSATPVPEPLALPVLLIGLAGLAFVRRSGSRRGAVLYV